MSRWKTALAGLALLVVAVVGSGCTAQRAREHVLTPAAVSAWESVRLDVARGVQVGLDTGAIVAGDGVQDRVATFDVSARAGVLLPGLWSSISPLAMAGIDDRTAKGEVGLGVAGSLRERVRLFTEAVVALGG